MIKQYVFTEKEFNSLMIKFSDNFVKFSKKEYGAKLYSNESKKVMKSDDYILGVFSQIWDKTIKGED